MVKERTQTISVENNRIDREVLEYLSDIFLSVHRLDLATGELRTIRPFEGLDDEPGRTVPFDSLMTRCAELYHPEDRSRFLRDFSLEVLRAEKAKEAARYEKDYRRMADGSYRWVSNCLYLNGDISPDAALLVQTDVSDRHLTYNVIEALGEEYFALYYIDLQEDIAQILRSDRKVTGKLDLTSRSKFSEKIAQYGDEFVHPEDREIYNRCVRYDYLRSRLTPENNIVMFAYRKKIDESYEWMEMKLVLNECSGGVPRYVTLAIRNIDSTMRQELEAKQLLQDTLKEAEHANTAKSEFLSRISHDIRTPLNTIMGITALSEAYSTDPEKLAAYLSKINIASNHLLTLINEILDMTRLENGQMDLDAMEFDLKELAEGTVNNIRPYIHNEEKRLELHMEKLQHTRVIGDQVRLQQAFTNILANAVKYSEKDACITVTLEELPWSYSSSAHYRFVCEDEGIGISPDFLPHIFEPFSREKDSRINAVSGTGLGLTIAQSIVSMMNGDIKVDSSPGKGTTVTVTFSLPIREADDAPAEQAAHEEEDIVTDPIIEERLFFGRRLLIVDDNEMNLDITREMIELTGAETDCARNGQEALNKYLSHPNGYYDLILMDVQMPVMNGLEATAAIRRTNRLDAETIPIVALTANTFTEDVKNAMEHGMTAHLPKPFNLHKMLGMIQKIMEL